MSHLSSDKPIAIVGAGLAGLTLALSLNRANISCIIYEMRPSNTGPAGGAIMLSPNALRILDTLGLYDSLRRLGWDFESLHYMEDLFTADKNGEEKQLAENRSFRYAGRYDFGSERKHGYKALRIKRSAVLSALKTAAIERGIKIEYGRKFAGVVGENQHEARIKFEDGGEVMAPLVVGADGIHSMVRTRVEKGVKPKYIGFIGINTVVDRHELQFPEEFGESGVRFPMPVTIQEHDGSSVFAPQSPDGSELFFGKQVRHPEMEPGEWKHLAAQKEKLRSMMVSVQSNPSDLVRSALENMHVENMGIWAFYTLPRLQSWSTTDKRVVLIGDAAHAIPPTAGQGATQAFEDAFSLAALLSHLPVATPWSQAIDWWQGKRQERIDQVLALTARLNTSRLSKQERDQLPADKLWSSDGEEDLGWLYNYRIEEEVIEWTKSAN